MRRVFIGNANGASIFARPHPIILPLSFIDSLNYLFHFISLSIKHYSLLLMLPYRSSSVLVPLGSDGSLMRSRLLFRFVFFAVWFVQRVVGQVVVAPAKLSRRYLKISTSRKGNLIKLFGIFFPSRRHYYDPQFSFSWAHSMLQGPTVSSSSLPPLTTYVPWKSISGS